MWKNGKFLLAMAERFCVTELVIIYEASRGIQLINSHEMHIQKHLSSWLDQR
jgi:hypothetical protein